jgi:hypothetical protein
MMISRLIKIFSKSRKSREVKQLEIEKINARLEKLEGDLEKAISGYKLMLIQNNPDILAELISGDSIETIDRSLSQARELTNSIKQNFEKSSASERIPAGAPARLPLDTNNLSSEEKIKYGLAQLK